MRDGAGCGADGGEAGRTAGELDPTRAARVDQVAPTDPAASPGGAIRSRRVAGLALLAAFALHALSFVGWFIDDAFITMRYGHNLASGHGMVFNLGERVEGYTDFTWVLLAALSLRLGVDPTLSFPIAGVVCGLGTVASVFATGGRLSRLDAPGAAWGGTIAAGLVATATGAAVYAVTGLETMLFTLLTTLGMTALLERRTARFAVCIGLAFLTRPEAALLGVFGAVWLCARALLRRAPWREFAIGVAILSAIVLPYLGWKLSYFGSIVPNTLYAKAPDRSAGWQYLWPPLAATAGLAAASLASLRSRDRRSQVGFFLALWMLWVLAVWWEGGDWMPSIRLLVPGIPFVALAADGEILDWVLVARRRPTRVALGVAAALVLAPWIVWNLRDHQTARTHFVVTETGVVPLMRLTHALVRAGDQRGPRRHRRGRIPHQLANRRPHGPGRPRDRPVAGSSWRQALPHRPLRGRAPGRRGHPVGVAAEARPRSTDGRGDPRTLVGGDLAQFIRVVSNELPVRLLGARHGALHAGAHGARRPRPRRPSPRRPRLPST
ncbi:MAG: hypothetical protein IPF99_12850 [Deltaproteobacteria bacterium]|nr:hypothetical protein [Deltaproteobacteria bacterium]